MSARSFRRARRRELEREEKRNQRLSGRSKAAVAAGAGLGATVLLAPAAEAATFTVSNLNDSGAGSLRQAVLDAEAAAGPDTVVFQSGLSGTITLTSGEIDITEELTIQGPGANVIAVSGNNSSRIFYASMASGDTAEEALVISGLTLTGGNESGGGAVYTDETRLTIEDVVLSGNVASGDGGAVYNTDGSITVLSSVISGNEAGQYGGGLHIEDNDAGDAVIRQSAVIGNNGDDGGGISLYDLNRNAEGADAFGAIIDRTTVSGNSATDVGGGIYIEDSYDDGGAVTIENSTISGNTAAGVGGGIAQTEDQDQPVRIRNSTVSGNSSDTIGGGVYFANDEDLRFEITNSTIVENQAPTTGGVYRVGADDQPDPDVDTTVLSSTIVANNTGGDLGEGGSAEGAFEIGFSLIGNPGNGTITETPAGSNITGVDPLLGPLADNGGPTRTHLPARSSPAVDAGISNGLATDQRGLQRTADQPDVADAASSDGTDIGSVERAAPVVPPEDTSVDSPALTAKKTQKQKGKKVKVKVEVGAAEAVDVLASGKIKADGESYELKEATASVNPGATDTMILKPAKKAAKKIAKVLEDGKKAKAKISALFTDAAGNEATEKVKVKLKAAKK